MVVAGEQLGVGADGGDPAVLEQRHPVGQRHRRRAVGDDQRGGVREHLAQPAFDQLLGAHVQRRERVVQDQHRGPGGDRPGQGEALALPAGQAQPLLADQRVDAVGQRVDEVGLRDVQRLRQQLVRFGGAGRFGAEQHVVADRTGEQRGVLERHGHDGAQLLPASSSRTSTPSMRMAPPVTS